VFPKQTDKPFNFPQTDIKSLWCSHKQTDKACGIPTNRQTKLVAVSQSGVQRLCSHNRRTKPLVSTQTVRQGQWCSNRQLRPVAFSQTGVQRLYSHKQTDKAICTPTNRHTKHVAFPQIDSQGHLHSRKQVYKGCDPKNRLTKHVAFPQTDRQGLWCSHRQRKPVAFSQTGVQRLYSYK
jgi:hypothetical protein